MIYNNILEAGGHTPMIRLQRLPDPDGAEVLVKYEGLNVGGSIKTRTAYNMILAGERDGTITPDTVIVEPTSGNQGIGLALVGAVRGYRTIIIMPDSVSSERKLLVEHYGAEVLLVHDEGNIGDCIQRCLEKARQMAKDDPRVGIPQIYEDVYIVSDEEAIKTAKALARYEGLMCGISSGTNVAAALRLAKKLGRGKTVVTILPDTAERYFSTPLFE